MVCHMTGTGLGEIVANEAGKGIGGAVGETLGHAWQAIIGDRVLSWRIGNAAKAQVPLLRKLAEQGLTLDRGKIPDGIIFTWFQKATETDEPELHELFARLLINASLGNEDALQKRNIELVSSLTPDDARLLEIIGRMFEWKDESWSLNSTVRMRRDAIFLERLKADGFEDRTSIDALISLGILRQEATLEIDRRAVDMIADVQIGNPRAVQSQARSIASRILNKSDYLIVTTVGLSLLQALAEKSG